MTDRSRETVPGLVPPSVAEFRARHRAQAIGPRYSGWLHFSFTSAASLTAIVWSLHGVRAIRPLELLTLPLTFLFANFAEWRGHRGPMHHLVSGLRLVHRRHTGEHHHFFTDEAMAVESSCDFKMVLFPPVMIAFFLGLMALPPALLLWVLLSENVARLYAATAVGYFLTYEWLHFSYHQPAQSFLGRRTVIRLLRQHHTLHHDLRLMTRHNFNITFPLGDLLFGTLFRRAPRA